MDSLLQDLRFALRTLRRRPLFSFIAILTLSLGIGSATTVFSVVEGVLLRPLPFHRPEQLVTVSQAISRWQSIEALRGRWDRVAFNQPAFQRVRDGQSSFTDIAAYRLSTVTLVEEERLTVFHLGVGSSSLFSALGISPILGRTFLPEEDGPAATPVALISQEIWETRFASEADIIGRSVNLSGESYTIVGVLPAGFRLRSFVGHEPSFSRGFWVPLGMDAEVFQHGFDWFQGIARLSPNVAIERAEEEATALIRSDEIASGYEAMVRSLTEEWTGVYRRPLTLLLGAALVLLLIACGNVAALLIGEIPGREGEIRTRRALGAGNRRIGQQLLVESLLLGVAGSVLGLVLSLLGTRILLGFAPPISRLEEVGHSGWVLLFSVVLGGLTSLGFGLAPVLQVRRGRAWEVLGSAGRIASGSGTLFHRALVAGEMALTVLLLVGGGLLAKTLFTLMDVETGFRQESLVEARVSVPSYLESGPALRRLVFDEMVDALRAIPGVLEASGTSTLPFSGSMSRTMFWIVGRPRREGEEPPLAQRREVYPDFFRAMGIPLVRGRTFVRADGEGAPGVAVISQRMAERYWPNQDPIGARFGIRRDTVVVVGVVGDVRHQSLRADPRPTFYLAAAQQASPTAMSLILRTDRDPKPVLPRIREAIRRVHAAALILRVEPVQSIVSESARAERFRAVLFVVFGAVAILLSGAGVFGVTARAVEARTREMGIRMALGAQSRNLVQLTLLPGLVAGLIGLSLGLVAALGASRLLVGFLFDVATWDPATYALVAVTVLGISLTATYLPSRRIRNLEPLSVLREE